MNDLQYILNMIFEANKKEKEQEKKKVLTDDEMNSIKEAAVACKKVYDEFTKVGFSKEFAEELILRIIDKISKV